MKKLEKTRALIRHQDFRLRLLNKDEIFDQREIDSIERSLNDIDDKFKEAIEELKKIKISEENSDHQRLNKSINHYKAKYSENKKSLKEKIADYLKTIK